MDETVNDGIVFDASDISPVANELTEEQAEETNSSAVEETSEGAAREDESSAEPAVSETQTWRVLQDTEKRMMEILKQFGLTTMSRSKIKIADGGMTAEQLLNSLIEA